MEANVKPHMHVHLSVRETSDPTNEDALSHRSRCDFVHREDTPYMTHAVLVKSPREARGASLHVADRKPDVRR